MKKTKPQFNPARYRRDFPILGELVHGKALTYFDNAATTHKPYAVIEAVSDFYASYNSNIHRGVHHLSEVATAAYEAARVTVQKFINAADPREIIFTRGTTESINLVAATFGEANIKKGDEVVISVLEHHANIVPWQMLCHRHGARLRVAPLDQGGRVSVPEFRRLINKKTKLVAIIYASNALGVINPIKEIIDIAHRTHVPVLVDAAQAVQHQKVDVRRLDCDFLVFSGHKVYGPTGIGILYGKYKLLENMPPYQTGGDMISRVTFEKTTFKESPHRFEAGTPHIAGAIGLAAAIDYVSAIGVAAINRYEKALLRYATDKLRTIDGLTIYGAAGDKAPIISFTIDGIHPHDLGTLLDQQGIAIRTGHHCAEPLMGHLNVPATARVSLAFYNTRTEVDRLVRAIIRVKKIFTI